MKNLFSTLLVFYVLFSGILYAQTNSFKIQGDIKGDYEGKNVRLNTLKNGESLHSYSSTVKNNTFCLEIDNCNSCDTLAKFLIGNNPDDEIILCLDDKLIQVYSDQGKIRIAGTELNNQYQQYRDSNNYYLKVLAPTLAKMKGTTSYLFDRRTEEYMLMKNWGKFKYHFIERNIQNPIGVYLFKNDLLNHFSVLFYKGHSAIVNLYNLADERIKSDHFAIEWKGISERNVQIHANQEKLLNTKITDFDVLTPDGSMRKISKIISNSDSKYFILDFWASWCSPCIASIPILKYIYEKYHKKGLEIIAVSIDEDVLSWNKKLKQVNTPWIDLIFDKDKISIEDLHQKYNFKSVPYSILLDKSGKIISFLWVDNKSSLESVLNQKLLN